MFSLHQNTSSSLFYLEHQEAWNNQGRTGTMLGDILHVQLLYSHSRWLTLTHSISSPFIKLFFLCILYYFTSCHQTQVPLC